jgi:sarcosine oxidase subunit delta
MHHIYCPYCEEIREEEEYSYTGEAHIVRPKDPASISDEAWGDYLFFRANPRGIHHEMWYHAAGCRRYFNATRDTHSYQIHETYKMGELPTVTAPIKVAPKQAASYQAVPDKAAAPLETQQGDAS